MQTRLISWGSIKRVALDPNTIRQTRLVCGSILFAYLTFHYVNHALGNISWEAAQRFTYVHDFIWRSLVGSIVLCGAGFTHLILAFEALYRRRSTRIEAAEGVRILLGLAIVPLLANHFLNVRYAWAVYDVPRYYDAVLYAYWVLNPWLGYRQALLILVAWIHGCIGLHFWLRLKPFYRRISGIALGAAVALPLLALLGVWQGARQIEALAQADPPWLDQLRASAHFGDPVIGPALNGLEIMVDIAFALALALLIAARGLRVLAERRHGVVRVSYPDGQVASIPVGLTVLDASKRAAIPHASVCGGRGRCSTCRVRIVRGADALPVPALSEKAILTKLRVGANVRLACQLRPQKDITVLPLLPPNVTIGDSRRLAYGGTERFLAVLFVDIRKSSKLVESRLPFDVVFLFNRFFEAVCSAVVTVGGEPNQFIGDGVLALFGRQSDAKAACFNALKAAQLIERNLATMNQELAAELPEPIAIGIGIHAGPVIVGELGYREHFTVTAIGDAVHVASRFQDLTKEYTCRLVVSEFLADTAGVDLASWPRHETKVRGRDEPVAIRAIDNVEAMVMAPLPEARDGRSPSEAAA